MTATIKLEFGSTPEHYTQMQRRITTLGAELGFHFDFFDGMRLINTRDAHTLLDYVRAEGKQTALKLRLFSA